MKILKLRSKNINSLKGEIEIDFTHEHFQNKIFAIVGETGAGKSSLLDVISLALYAQTTRLKENVSLVISESCHDAFSEVLFEINGKEYRSRFEQQKKENEILFSMHLYLDNRVICTGLASVCSKVEELIGLDFGEFTQSVILSQGVFDTFLKSAPKERVKLLEKVTKTEVYAKISKNVFERARKENETFERMETLLKNLIYLDPKKRESLEQRVRILEKEKASYDIEKILNTYHEKISFDKLTQDSISYKKELEKLQKVLLPKQLEEKKHQDFLRFLTAEKKKIEQAKLLDHELEFSNKNLTRIRNEIEQLKEELSYVEQHSKDTDHKLSQLHIHKTLLEKEMNAFVEMNHLQQNYTLISSKFNERIKYQEELKTFKSTVHEVLSDRPLCDKITNLESKVLVLDKQIKAQNIERIEQQNLIVEKKILKLLEKERLEKSQVSLLDSKKKQEEEVKALEEQNSNLKREEVVLIEVIEQLEEKKVLEEKIINYERDRALLKDNEPCPLCGATEHPLFSENIEPNKTEQILAEKKLSQKNLLERIGENEKKIIEFQVQIKQIVEKLVQEKKSLMGLHEIKGDLQALKEEHEVFEKQLHSVRYQRDEFNLLKNKIASSKEELSQLRVKIQREKNRQKVEEQLHEKIQELSYFLIKTLRIYNMELNEYSMTILDAKRKQYVDVSSNLKKLLEEVAPIEGERLQNSSKKLYMEESLRSLRKRESMQKCDILLIEQNRVAIIGEKSIVAYREELAQKTQKQEESYDEFLKLKTLFEEKKNQYFSSIEKLERQSKLKLVDLKKVENEKNMLQEKLAILNQELGSLKSQINQDKENIKRREKEQHSLDEQEEIAKEWSMLNNLIGSSDGEKYQIFAQSLTLSRLIGLANEHLKKLNHRYLLTLKNSETLELEVVDLYQNKNKRGVETLSGGESFIVSLALSLGLLELNSDQIEINTLFLDEGFETLDENSLNMVIETLKNLKSQGKIIGIISHIPLLKEQIKTQVKLEKQEDGFSKLAVVC